jgi:hypothetical protein
VFGITLRLLYLPGKGPLFTLETRLGGIEGYGRGGLQKHPLLYRKSNLGLQASSLSLSCTEWQLSYIIPYIFRIFLRKLGLERGPLSLVIG